MAESPKATIDHTPVVLSETLVRPGETEQEKLIRSQVYLKESLETNWNDKHSYFRYEPTLAVGDINPGGSPFRRLVGIETQAPFKLGNKMHKGKTKDVYFSQATPMCVGDPYKRFEFALDREQHAPNADGKYFKSTVRPNRRGDYEYVSPGDPTIPAKALYARNKERTYTRGIFTSPAKRGKSTPNILLSKFPEWQPESNGQATRGMRNPDHFDVPFKNNSHGGEPFWKDSKVYEGVAPGTSTLNINARNMKPTGKVPDHSRAFFPNNAPPKGPLGTIGKFIGLKGEYHPKRNLFRSDRRIRKEGEGEWKDNTRQLKTKPTPSIALNMRNLRSERPQSFARF